MTEGERMSVCEQPNRREKVGRIITLLRGKGDWDLDIFMNLLRKSGNEVWAGQLEEKVWLIKTDPQGEYGDPPIGEVKQVMNTPVVQAPAAPEVSSGHLTYNLRKKMLDEECDYVCKVILLGESGVGKSNLLSCYTWNMFNLKTRPSVGVDFDCKIIEVDSKAIKAYIWDTAGQERFRSVTTSYYREIHGAALLYDITDLNSYKKLDEWLTELRDRSCSNIVTMLVGNKCDLRQKQAVATTEAIAYAAKNSMLFCETSAKDGTGVEAAFHNFLTKIYQTGKLQPPNFQRKAGSMVVVKTSPMLTRKSWWKGHCRCKKT